MNAVVTTVTERGQVSIPASVRRRMGLRANAKVVWEVRNDGACEVRRVETPTAIGARAVLGWARRYRSLRRTEDWMRDLRAGERA